MNNTSTTPSRFHPGILAKRYSTQYLPIFAGAAFVFGFAPFHLPGMAILSLAIFFTLLTKQSVRHAFYTGFYFGIGAFGVGVSWVYVSIHEYGHIHPIAAALITLLFISYLALYPALMAYAFKKLSSGRTLLSTCFLFSALWCLNEWLRATILGGFPWLLMGFGQIDTPLKFLLPIVGIFGISFFASLAASFLAISLQAPPKTRALWILAFLSILLTPSLLHPINWSHPLGEPLSVGVIQSNLSMHDKWDESLFWQLLGHYQHAAEKLVIDNDLVVMPESAIPVPLNYLNDFLENLQETALKHNSSILLGGLQPNLEQNSLYNAMISLGDAEGFYQKQRLVPFGEFIPKPFYSLMLGLGLPVANLQSGSTHQPLIKIKNIPIATLICYELAYPNILRRQLPSAAWIVSISDDGWFGHSFAMPQQLQMAQTLSAQTARFQVMANNDGLSSIIDANGEIVSSLKAYSAGLLNAKIQPMTGASPWTSTGDSPMLFISLFIVSLAIRIKFFSKREKK